MIMADVLAAVVHVDVVIPINTMINNSPAEILNALHNSQKPILCVDGRMDLDAYCSSLAVYNIVKKLSGKRVSLFSSHPELSGYHLKVIKAFNIDISEIKFGADPISLDFSDYDLQIFIDSGTIEHISQNSEFKVDSHVKKLNIDHHGSNTLYGDYNYVKEYSSACSVLYEVLKSAEPKIEIDAYMAKLLVIGMLSDSIFLRTSNVKPHEFCDVGNLVKISGFPVYKLNQLLSTNSIEDTKLKKIIFRNLIIDKPARYAYSFASLNDYLDEGLDPEYKGVPPADVIKTIEGLDFVFFIREDKDKFNVSFRSVDMGFDVLKFAEALNGGGHKVAAAGTVQADNIEAAIDAVIKSISVNTLN